MAYMLQTNTNGQRIAPFVPTTLDFCALCNMAIIVRLASACVTHKHWTVTSLPSATLLRTCLSDVFRSLNCKPLKDFRVFLKCHAEFLWASILQSFRDTSSRLGELSPFVVVSFFISFLLSSFFPPLCEIFVLYWHGEHPSHQCLHASTVPGGARGGEGGAHWSPTIAKSGIQWKSSEEWDLTVCLGAVYQVVRHGWLKDAHRIHQRCCCFAERIKDYDASRVAVTVYCIIFVNLFFFCKGWI